MEENRDCEILFDSEGTSSVYMYDNQHRSYVTIVFDNKYCVYDPLSRFISVPVEHLEVSYEDDYYEKEVEELKKAKVETIVLEMVRSKNLHYIM